MKEIIDKPKQKIDNLEDQFLAIENRLDTVDKFNSIINNGWSVDSGENPISQFKAHKIQEHKLMKELYLKLGLS